MAYHQLKGIERRQHKRYQAKENLIVYDSEGFGQVENISMGGLRFRVLRSRDYILPPSFNIGLLCAEAKTYFDNLPCQLVSITPSTQLEQPARMTRSVQVGIKFIDLTMLQQKQLSSFITMNKLNTSKNNASTSLQAMRLELCGNQMLFNVAT